MGSGTKSFLKIFVVALLAVMLAGVCSAKSCGRRKPSKGLVNNFYRSRCPRAEAIVKRISERETEKDPGLGAKLIRMHFHDCFVRGCDGSILLDRVGTNNNTEKLGIPNLTVLGFEIIDEIKTAVEAVCPGVVSCADILALAARDTVSFPVLGHISIPWWPLWNVPTGRRDGVVSLESETIPNIPPPFANFTTLLQSFAVKGLDLDDLVLLSGAHTIGVAHCNAFSNRLYNFTGIGDADPSLDPTYAATLRKQCPNPADPDTVVGMDPGSVLTFDNNYYKTVSQNRGLFQSDAALLTNAKSARLVNKLKSGNTFFSEFADSMVKMGRIEELVGKSGQIRKQCRFVNP